MTETHDTKFFRIDYSHLAFLFLGAVCVCAVFFALGFVVGRAQAFETALKDQEEVKSIPNSATSPSASGSAPEVTKDDPAPAAEPAGKSAVASHEAPRADYRKDLDFYSAVKEPKVDQNFHPDSPKSSKNAGSAKRSKTESEGRSASAPGRNESGGRGLVSLQVAALKSSAEADRMAKTLRSKGYPVFIVNPDKDDASKLIRVQIGPYASEAEATKVKARLGTEGYTAISKH